MAAADKIVTTDHEIQRSIAIDLIDGVHSLITPERRSYSAVCLALLHVLASTEVGSVRESWSASRQSTPLQRAKDFAILMQICPSLTKGFENDSHIEAAVALSLVSAGLKKIFRTAPSEVFSALVERGLEGHKGSSAAGHLAKNAIEGVQKILETNTTRDEPSLRVFSRGDTPQSNAGRPEDIPDFDKLSHVELLTWIEDRVKTATREVLNPSESELRRQWRSGC